MDPITIETNIQMTTSQFITLLVVLVMNTSAIVAAWYRFGYRISKVENDARKTRQEILELRAKNTSEAHIQLRKEYDQHVTEARCVAKDTADKLNIIIKSQQEIGEKLNTHIEIHKDRERGSRRRPTNGD
jgi:hypothetical protein